MRFEAAALWFLALGMSGCHEPPAELGPLPPPARRAARAPDEAAARPDVAPSGIEVEATPDGLLVSWVGSPDPMVLGYDVYRSSGEGSPIVRVNPVLVLADRWLDDSAQPGFEYRYRVAAVDRLGRSRFAADRPAAELRP